MSAPAEVAEKPAEKPAEVAEKRAVPAMTLVMKLVQLSDQLASKRPGSLRTPPLENFGHRMMDWAGSGAQLNMSRSSRQASRLGDEPATVVRCPRKLRRGHVWSGGEGLSSRGHRASSSSCFEDFKERHGVVGHCNGSPERKRSICSQTNCSAICPGPLGGGPWVESRPPDLTPEWTGA